MKPSFVSKAVVGLFAAGIAATAMLGTPRSASAECNGSPQNCIQILPYVKAYLQVVDVTAITDPNGWATITYTIKNQGLLAANSGFFTSFVITGVPGTTSLSEATLAAGQTRVRVISLYVGAATIATFTVKADANNTVNELYEGNNSLVKTIVLN